MSNLIENTESLKQTHSEESFVKGKLENAFNA